ncbi:hypothetical protein N7474_007640 [Penicillium riverlandense]|uniref:uncharacterized protein n=1 Tax=Penicillium riverlandense TaxID=1903569 RepID=UPI0025479051|nr:uncharacterized protein N7474_007640 [Penicillium riverlandense]KAJ5811339.1 hypothetical protein N7474_007640 [Penicillium riverlandense]
MMRFRNWVLLSLSGCGLAETITTLNTAISNCPPLGAVLPPPKKPSTDAAVKAVLSELEVLQKEVSVQFGNATGLSLSIASAYEDDVLASLSYTPPLYNCTGTHKVDGDTVFRIASVSKVFTVLGLLLLGDKVNFSDPITKYVPELNRLKAEQKVQNRVTTVDWDLISIDALASQLAGVGSNLGNDLANNPALNLTKYGLPDLAPGEHSECGDLPSSKTCTWEDFWNKFGRRVPSYGPYTTPAYSDVTYDILGLAIERVSGESYGDFIQKHIFTPLNMTRSYVSKPEDDSIGFISREPNFWSTSMGFEQADGGFYSSAHDLTRFGQAILKHELIDEVTTNAWLKPRSHTSSLGFSVGAPWEIGRANNLTLDGRIIDVYSKIGGLPDYDTLFMIIPDYGLTVSMISAGQASSVTTQLGLANQDPQALSERLRGSCSIKLGIDDQSGLHVQSWVMNGQDILEDYPIIASFGSEPSSSSYLSVRLFPTGLQSKVSSAWRAVYNTLPPAAVPEEDALFILQVGCQSWETIDNLVYGYNALDDFVFGLNSSGDAAISITPRAFRQTLTRV